MARFCIRSVTAQERARLEAAGVEPHDCLGVCSVCFERVVVVRGGVLLGEGEVKGLMGGGAEGEEEETERRGDKGTE